MYIYIYIVGHGEVLLGAEKALVDVRTILNSHVYTLLRAVCMHVYMLFEYGYEVLLGAEKGLVDVRTITHCHVNTE